MELIISNSSGRPIYEQITNQIKGLILTGELTAGEMLPSMRQLARDLHISVITTKRAYEELEKEGLVYTVAGKGCYVGGRNPDRIREEGLRQMEEHLNAVRKLAAELGLDREEVFAVYDTLAEMDE